MARHRSSEKAKKSRKKYIITKLVCFMLSILFTIGGIASIAYYKTLSSIGYQEINTNSNSNTLPSGETVATEAEILTIDTNSGNLISDPYVLNIMLFGADQYGDSGNSDTMILMSIDNRHEKIKLTSFMRDTYISIPGYYSSKLNAAYANGGAELSIKTIESNYGIKIDRYAIVNFETFKDIVDIMGGVDIELTDDEISYINAQIAQNNQSDYLPWDTQAGLVHLNGQQALWHARNRGGYVNGTYFYMNDDWGRVERQRAFLEAVMDSLKGASLTDIVQIVNAVGPNITTNFKNSEITTLVAGALTYLSYDMEEMTIPTDGNWYDLKNEAGQCIGVIDWNLNRYELASFIYEDSVVN